MKGKDCDNNFQVATVLFWLIQMISYKTTQKCCYVGFVVQALVINFLPLLFVTFKNEYDLSYALLGTLIGVNFVTQIAVDVFSVFMLDRIGYRKAAVTAQFLCALGFMLLTVLPEIISPFWGIAISVVLYSVGAGLIEVVINPIIAGLPKEKGGNIVLAHSFYSWGQLAVVLFTTFALRLFLMQAWRYISLIWALIPLINGLLFLVVPISPPASEEKREGAKSLFANKTFLAILCLMICAGGSELAMAQWASAFAQDALGLDKTMGDLLGPCMFAFFMGVGRVIYGLYSKRINYRTYAVASAVLCVLCYVATAISHNPFLSLAGCGICGFAISTFWPGVVELAAEKFQGGSGAMFSAVAVFGDVGCSIAPFFTGVIASVAALGENAMRVGMIVNAIYPIVFMVIILKLMKSRN